MSRKNILLKSAIFLFFAGFVFAGHASAATEIRVTAGEQPKATIVPPSAIIPFTRFSIDYPGEPYFLDEVEVAETAYSGYADQIPFINVLLIAKKSPGINKADEERVVGVGVISPLNWKASIRINELHVIKDNVSFEIAAASAADLGIFAGKQASFKITNIKTIFQYASGTPEVSGLPIAGATHTINSTLKTGKLSLKILPEKVDSLQITETTGIEDVELRKIVLKGRFDGVILNETGGYFACNIPEKGHSFTACNFFDYSSNNAGLTLLKNNSLTFTGMRDGYKVDLPLPEAYDIVSQGKTYGYGLLSFAAGGGYSSSSSSSTSTIPTITSIVPNQGTANTNVTIYGTGLSGDPVVEWYDLNGKLVGTTLPFSMSDTKIDFTISGIFAANSYPGNYQIGVVTNKCKGGCNSNRVNFTLLPGPDNSYIKVISPNGGEKWQTGSTQIVTFQSDLIKEVVDLELVLQSNAGYETIATIGDANTTELNNGARSIAGQFLTLFPIIATIKFLPA